MMAELTPQQRAIADAMIAGSHFKVDPGFTTEAPGPDVVFPSSRTAQDVVRVTPEGLNVRGVQTVAINPFTQQPILEGGGNNRAVRQVMSDLETQAIRDVSMLPSWMTDPRSRSADADTVDTRMPQTAYFPFDYSPEDQRRAQGTDTVMVSMPRRRPNIEANPGTVVPTWGADTGRFGVKMSPGMTRNRAGVAGTSGLPGIGSVRSAIMRAPTFTPAPVMVAAQRNPEVVAMLQQQAGPAAYTPQGNLHPGVATASNGNDMAHMPRSYQDNPRNWNGGY